MANTKPIFTGTPVISSVRLTGSFTNFNTSDSGLQPLFTPDPTYGSYVRKIRARFVGGSSMTTSPAVDNVLKIGISGSGNNIELFDEISMSRLSLSATQAGISFEIPVNMTLGTGDVVYVGLTKVPTSSNIDVVLIGGHYTQQ